MLVHQQVRMKLVNRIHKSAGRPRVTQLFSRVLIDGNCRAFLVVAWIKIHFVPVIRFPRECHLRDSKSGMRAFQPAE